MPRTTEMPVRRRRDSEIPPLPPIPRPRCPVCRRTVADVLRPQVGECTRLPGDADRSYSVMDCNYTALQRVHKELQERETELLSRAQQSTAEAIAQLIETTKHSGLDGGIKSFLARAIRNGVWRKRLGS